MLKKILVPTDFSKHAKSAFHYAEELASQSNGEVHVHHIIETPSASVGGSFNVEGEVNHDASPEDMIFAKSLIGRVKERIKRLSSDARNKHVKFHSHIELGSPLPSISEMVENHNMDIMIIGSRGTHNLGEDIVGSTAEKIVRNAEIPVIVVKSELEELKLRNIVLASEFYDDLDNIVPYLKEFQKLFGSTIHLLRVNTPNDFHTTRLMRSSMEEFAKKHSLDNYTVNIYSDILEEDGIIYFGNDIDADLIVMPTHGRKGLMHLLSGSIAEDVVNHAKRPVMTFKVKK